MCPYKKDNQLKFSDESEGTHIARPSIIYRHDPEVCQNEIPRWGGVTVSWWVSREDAPLHSPCHRSVVRWRERLTGSPPGGAIAYQRLHHSINRQVANVDAKKDASLALSPIFHYVSVESPL
ncbi:hypothetical protein TNCV_3808881 [Trichonephila clavipes]|nr:hypothetical protein TNCV_3808881 [Trichonephila clavipes]